MNGENKIPLNLYGIMDSELARMHNLLQVFLSLPVEPSHRSSAHASGHTPSGNHHGNISEIYKRIVTMQDLLLQSLVSHDKELQNRIAEIALMD